MAGEHSPMLRVWGGALAPHVARLISIHPRLLMRFARAPRRALHSYAAYIYYAIEKDKANQALALRLETTDPRELLVRAFPGCDRRFYRALDKAGDRVHEATFYTRLDRLLRGPLAEPVLAAEALNMRVLTCHEAVQRMDPLVVRARHALCGDPRRAEALDSLARMLRSFGVLDNAVVDRLPEGAGQPALGRFLRRQMGMIRAPDPGFTPPEGLRLIGSVRELHEAGVRMNNCLRRFGDAFRTYWVDLATGHRAFLVADDPSAAICLRRCGPSVWYLEQVAGRSNAALTIEAQGRIESKIDELDGAVVLRQHPQYVLADVLDRKAEAAGDDLGAVDEIPAWLLQ
jgi:hypothetical protein